MKGSMNLPTSEREIWSERNLDDRETQAVEPEWMFRGRTAQQPPRADWQTWLILGGRGPGKTRMGAEWVDGVVQAYRPFSDARSCNVALVGETLADAREVMIDGPSGIMAVSRAGRPRYEMARWRLLWTNGATAAMFSSEDPDSLRGPQFDAAWCDGSVARDLKAVALIPGATEFGLSPQLVTDEPSKGETRRLNRNCLRDQSDWQASMDELQALSPLLKHVAIVVPWFGTDLRAGQCLIKPGVMDRAGHKESSNWRGGISRDDAHLISCAGNGAAYGGTPSDQSVIAAIRDAKARGLSVMLYPFVTMDIRADNQLPDPYGGTRQAAYPWRGRITCHPAPYRPGSVNGTAAAAGQVAAFLGGVNRRAFFRSRMVDSFTAGRKKDWGYRRMVLHLAHLAVIAGGVDSFLLGSELCSLTMIRDQSNGFPFVNALCDLASELRDVLGGACKLTYGADWTEYFGHHPQDGSGDVYFHLDPLWAHPAIDAVGIDNYMPLSDWRDEDYSIPNPDGFATPYDLNGLLGQIASGEGFDWYYTSDNARSSRTRTPIADGSGKPWVYRYKDLAGWGQNAHYNRVGGVESAVPTEWQPSGKPIWFTELGCPATDKGPNQPNVFPDMKSSEGAFPYFSDHGRCDLAQNRFLRAHFGHWNAGNGAGMLDSDRIYVWAWETRPFPEFPLRKSLWSDGDNWTSGHWLNGRLSGVALDELMAALAADFGAMNVDANHGTEVMMMCFATDNRACH